MKQKYSNFFSTATKTKTVLPVSPLEVTSGDKATNMKNRVGHISLETIMCRISSCESVSVISWICVCYLHVSLWLGYRAQAFYPKQPRYCYEDDLKSAEVMVDLQCWFAWFYNHHGDTLLGVSMRVSSRTGKIYSDVASTTRVVWSWIEYQGISKQGHQSPFCFAPSLLCIVATCFTSLLLDLPSSEGLHSLNVWAATISLLHRWVLIRYLITATRIVTSTENWFRRVELSLW